MAKSTIVVVPPHAAALVPVSKVSEATVPPNGISMWVCASTPPGITYLSVASKAASFAFLLRIFLGPLASVRPAWEPLLIVVAIATMTIGNLAAITQSNIKRLLAYSSISHAGYMLLGLIAGNATGIKGISVYVLVYTFMNLGAFLVVISLRRKGIMRGSADTAFNAIPVVGPLKSLAEVVRGRDFLRDRRRAI